MLAKLDCILEIDTEALQQHLSTSLATSPGSILEASEDFRQGQQVCRPRHA